MDKVKKSEDRLLADLEDHLFLLSQHLKHLRIDRAYFKAISGELRLLICKSGGKGLLWRLVDRYKVSEDVELYKIPDTGNGGGSCYEAHFIDRPPKPVNFPVITCKYRELIRSTAVLRCGREYNYEDLIKAIADKMGSAHEDEDIMEYVFETEKHAEEFKWVVINPPDYIEILIDHAELTLEIGERILAVAECKGVYTRKRQRIYSPVSGSTKLRTFRWVQEC